MGPIGAAPAPNLLPMAPAPGGARRAATSGAWLLAENAVRLGVTAAVSFWIARALGPAEFGLLNFASALTAILYALATLGLEVPAVLRLARGDAAGLLLGTVLRLRFVASLGAMALAGAAVWALRHGDAQAQTVTLIVALSVVGYVPVAFDYVFKARVDAGPPARARVATTVLSAGAKIIVLLAGWGLVALAWTVVFESIVASVLMWSAWRRHRRLEDRCALDFDRALARALLRQSLPLLGVAVAVALQLKLDVVLLGHLASDVQAGQYALAQKLSEVLYIVPVVLVDSLYPLLAGRLQTPGAQRNDQLMFDLAAAAGICCALASVALAQVLIVGTFGAAYEGTVVLWQWHALTCVAVALDVARQRWLVAHGMQGKALRFALVGASISVAFNAALIPVFGAPAAAGVAVVSWFAAGLGATFADRSVRALAWMQWRALWPWVRLWRQLRARVASRAAL